MRIVKDFKSNELVSADCRGVMGVFGGSADGKGVRPKGGIREQESRISDWTQQLERADVLDFVMWSG